MKYDAVVFDLFGTLVPILSMEEYMEFQDRVSAALGVSPADFMGVWEGMADDRTLGRVRVVTQLEAMCRRLGVSVTPAAIDAVIQLRTDVTAQLLVLRDDAREALVRLRERGLRIGLISDCSEDVVAAWPETPLASMVDAAILSAEVGLKKPDPRIYHLACERLGVVPRRCLYVGDGGSRELSGALAAGMEAVLIRRPEDEGGFRRDEEKWEGPRISSLRDLLALVQ